MKQRVWHAVIASAPQQDQLGFAALPGDRSGAAQSAQGVVISFDKRRVSLGEHRDREDSPDPRKGAENLNVTVLGKVGVLLQLIDDLVQARVQLRELFVEQAQMREQ
jgi:hypothetical protein